MAGATLPLIQNDKLLCKNASTRQYFCDEHGQAKVAGTILQNPLLAGSLRMIAKQGPAALYGGALGDAVVEAVEKAQNGAQSRLGHTGYLKDPLLGDELYAQARQYRAGTGRFTSRDEWSGDNLNPITLNKYLYGNGNPGSYVDPDGRCPVCLLFLFGAELGFSGSVISQELFEGKDLSTVDYGRAGVEGVVGGASAVTGAGLVAAGARTGFAVAGGVAADTVMSTGVDAAYTPPDEFVLHESLATNATIATASLGVGAAGGVLVDRARPMVSRWWNGSSAALDQELENLVPQVSHSSPAATVETPDGGVGIAVEVPKIELSETIGQEVYGPHYAEALELSQIDPDFFPHPDAPGTRIVQGSSLAESRAQYERLSRQGVLPRGHHRQGLAFGGENQADNIQFTGETTMRRAELGGLDLGFYEAYGKPDAKVLKLHMTNEDGVLVFGNNPRHTEVTEFQNRVIRWQREEGLRSDE